MKYLRSGRGLGRSVAAVVVAQVLLIAAFVEPGHEPRPNGLPVALVGSGPAALELRKRLDDRGLEVVTHPDAGAARTAIDSREVYGAFLLNDREPALLVASAAGAAAAQTLEGVARAAGISEVRDVVPLDADDPRGTSLNLLLLPLVVTGLLGASLAAVLVREAGLGDRLGLAVATAAPAGLASTAFLQGVLGVLPGSYLAQAGLVALALAGLLLVAGGLIRLLGTPGLGVAFALFVVLGVPGSGAASVPELLPTPWAQAGAYLTPGALGTALRNVAYFDGAALARPVAVLVAVLAVGFALEAVAARRRPAGTGPDVA